MMFLGLLYFRYLNYGRYGLDYTAKFGASPTNRTNKSNKNKNKIDDLKRNL